VIRAHQPGSEPVDIPEVIPNPVVVPKPAPVPTDPAHREPVRLPDEVPRDASPADLTPIRSSALHVAGDRWYGAGALPSHSDMGLIRT
jgi:hypothetical protein